MVSITTTITAFIFGLALGFFISRKLIKGPIKKSKDKIRETIKRVEYIMTRFKQEYQSHTRTKILFKETVIKVNEVIGDQLGDEEMRSFNSLMKTIDDDLSTRTLFDDKKEDAINDAAKSVDDLIDGIDGIEFEKD